MLGRRFKQLWKYLANTLIRQCDALCIAEALAITNQQYSSGRPDWLYSPKAGAGTFTVCKHDVEAEGSWLNGRSVVMDQYSGKVLDLDDPAIGTAGEIFTQWQWALHSGQPLGWPGRIAVFLSGLACPVLFVTGVIRWQQKRRAKAYRNRST